MKQIELSHLYTPDSIKSINDEIETALGEETVDTQRLLDAVEKRDSAVLEYLKVVKGAQKRQFCEKEIEVNQALVDTVTALGRETLSKATASIRNRKALSKYLE